MPQTQSATIPQKLVTVKEAARILGLGERTVWTMRHTGQLPFVKIGSAVRFPVSAIDAWIESQTHTVGGCR
jgi:excisionase family DNA binding protein